MKISERCAQNPAAVAAASAIVLLFGVLALLRLPIQLLPDTRRPELFINAEWREAAPSELEEAIIEPIEEAMRGLPGMVEMRSESNRGRGGVGLTFEVGTDMTRVMLDVVSRLNTLPPLPPDAEAGSIPSSTPVSDALSRALKRRGFRFVGTTIVYAFMQSVGLVDDHLPACFRYRRDAVTR